MGSTTTKRSLKKLLAAAVSEYFVDKETTVHVADNGVNFNGNSINLDLREKNVIVHAPDTDVFALLIAHYKVLSAKQLHLVWAHSPPTHIDIFSVARSL